MIDVLARYVAMPVIGVVLLVVVAVSVGALIAWLVLPSRKKVRRLEADLAELTQTHARYKGDVLEHFQKTSELFGQLTESYRTVYRHLARGAETLCGDATALEGSVFGGARLLGEPVLDIGERKPAGDASSRSAMSDASDEAKIDSPAAAGAGEASDPGSEREATGVGGQTSVAEATSTVADDDRVLRSTAAAEQPSRSQQGGEWRMEAPSRTAPPSDADDSDDDDEVGRASFERSDSSGDEDSNRDVLAARSH